MLRCPAWLLDSGQGVPKSDAGGTPRLNGLGLLRRSPVQIGKTRGRRHLCRLLHQKAWTPPQGTRSLLPGAFDIARSRRLR